MSLLDAYPARFCDLSVRRLGFGRPQLRCFLRRLVVGQGLELHEARLTVTVADQRAILGDLKYERNNKVELRDNRSY